MRLIIIIQLLFSSMLAMAQSYGIEEWTSKHNQYIAPLQIQKFMQESMRKDYLDCIQYASVTTDEAKQYFSSVEIKLNSKGTKCHLVFPSKYCAAFYGAHAIAYWLIAEPIPNKFKI